MQFNFFLFQGPEHKNVCLWASGFLEPRFVICFTRSSSLSSSWWSTSSAKAKSCSIIIEIILIIYLLSIVPKEQNEYQFIFFHWYMHGLLKILTLDHFYGQEIVWQPKDLHCFWVFDHLQTQQIILPAAYLPCWATLKFDHLIICRATWGQKRGEEKSKSGPGKHWSQVHISGSYSIAIEGQSQGAHCWFSHLPRENARPFFWCLLTIFVSPYMTWVM